jgi:hypothetical protein
MAFKPALIRQIHQYFGLFIAPCVMFFSLTGAYQLFGWHESHEGYHPPALVEKLGMLHKDQLFITRPERRPPAAAAKPKDDEAPAAKSKAQEVEKASAFQPDCSEMAVSGGGAGPVHLHSHRPVDDLHPSPTKAQLLGGSGSGRGLACPVAAGLTGGHCA